MTCKGICIRHKAQKPVGSGRYASGQKRCQICEIFIKWDGLWCPCCGYRLRTKPRNLKYKAKLRARKKRQKSHTLPRPYQFMYKFHVTMQNEGSDITVVRYAKSETRRIFLIKFLSFQNGCFISLAEGSNRIGSISVSISSSNKVNTAKVIPSKFDSMFVSTNFREGV